MDVQRRGPARSAPRTASISLPTRSPHSRAKSVSQLWASAVPMGSAAAYCSSHPGPLGRGGRCRTDAVPASAAAPAAVPATDWGSDPWPTPWGAVLVPVKLRGQPQAGRARPPSPAGANPAPVRAEVVSPAAPATWLAALPMMLRSPPRGSKAAERGQNQLVVGQLTQQPRPGSGSGAGEIPGETRLPGSSTTTGSAGSSSAGRGSGTQSAKSGCPRSASTRAVGTSVSSRSRGHRPGVGAAAPQPQDVVPGLQHKGPGCRVKGRPAPPAGTGCRGSGSRPAPASGSWQSPPKRLEGLVQPPRRGGKICLHRLPAGIAAGVADLRRTLR